MCRSVVSMGSNKETLRMATHLFTETYKHTWRKCGPGPGSSRCVLILYCRHTRPVSSPTVCLIGRRRRTGLWRGNQSEQELWLLDFWLFDIVSSGSCQALGKTLATGTGYFIPAGLQPAHLLRLLGPLHIDCSTYISVAMTTLTKQILWGKGLCSL